METFKLKILSPFLRALHRLIQPDVRIVSGGIAFYALFAIFPIIYLTLTLMGALLPEDVAHRLAGPISKLLTAGVEPLSGAEIDTIQKLTPTGVTLRAFVALLLVIFTAITGAKAAIIGIRMIAGSTRSSNVVKFQGVSLLLTAALILAIWVLGAAQVVMTAATQGDNNFTARFAAQISSVAETLWISRWIASFVVFYTIIALSLRGHISGGRAKMAGAAVAALAQLGVTYLFQLYLSVTTLDTLYGALSSVILGFIWLSASVLSLLLGAALATEWAKVWREDDDIGL
jgi:membrane protein